VNRVRASACGAGFSSAAHLLHRGRTSLRTIPRFLPMAHRMRAGPPETVMHPFLAALIACGYMGTVFVVFGVLFRPGVGHSE
jgi:hypothetical protein